MNETNHPISPDEADVLVTRLIDGEATEDDERAFDHLADANPLLWRDLALRQRDAARLASAVDRRLAAADRITLASARPLAVSPPRLKERTSDAIPFPHAARRHFNWLFASAGWAAAVALLLLWRLAPGSGSFDPHQPPHVQHAAQLTPDEQLRSYLKAPYVIGEDAVMERIDTLSDGRIAVLAVRRIQEVLILGEDDPLPVDEDLYFMKDPAELRASH